MTKREICERLLKIYNSAMFASNGSGDIGGGPCYGIGKALRDLLLDLAAPEEAEPKAEEKHPGVIAKPGKDGEIEWCWCQKCYAQAAVVHNPFGDGENWGYCQKCGVSFRLKRGEGEK